MLNVIDEPKNIKTTLIQGRKSMIVDSIKLKVAAKMEDVTVKIENDIREIAALEVSFLYILILKEYISLKRVKSYKIMQNESRNF